MAAAPLALHASEGGSRNPSSPSLALPAPLGDDPSRPKRRDRWATVFYQLNALTRKQILVQRRAYCTNICQIVLPALFVVGLVLLQVWVDALVGETLDKDRFPETQRAWFTVERHKNSDVVIGAGQPLALLHTPELFPANRSMPLGRVLPNGTKDGLFGDWPLGFDFDVTTNVRPIRIPEGDPPQPQDAIDRDFTFWLPYYTEEVPTTNDMNDLLWDAWDEGLLYVGGYTVRTLDFDNQYFEYDIHTNESAISLGSDLHIAMSYMTNAISKHVTSRFLGPSEIFFSGLRLFPQREDSLEFDLISLAGPFFYTIILHLLFPVFVSNLVSEKENRVRELGFMMGLKGSVYYVVHYLFDYILFTLTAIFLVVSALVFQFRFFTINDLFLIVVLFVIWGHALVAFSFLASTFFTKARTATVTCYFYIIAIAFVSTFLVDTLVRDVTTPQWVHNLLSIWPSFALYRALIYFSREVSFEGPGIRISDAAKEDTNVFSCYLYLLGEIIIMLFLAWYCESVLPTGYGVKKNPFFCFLPSTYKSCWSCCIPKKDKGGSVVSSTFHSVVNEPLDVAEERKRVYSGLNDSFIAIKLVNIHKQFGRWWYKKTVVNNVTLGINKGECIGMIGHNGAGKTTLINIISGLFSPSHGILKLYGFDGRSEMSHIHQIIGICPQHDILWPEMTASEHLHFYGRLKHLRGKKLRQSVNEILKKVRLYDVRNKKAGKYSGGMKRRLSVAIAMIGDPRVVFLDEPASGLDPFSRQVLWEVIKEMKANRTILLTTHSMEEAEALCDRIAVMSKGELKAIGTCPSIKQRFGNGLTLTVSLDARQIREKGGLSLEECRDRVIAFVDTLCPSTSLISSVGATLRFRLPAASSMTLNPMQSGAPGSTESLAVTKTLNLSDIFRQMDEQKDDLHILEWVLQSATLEEAFISLTGDFEKNFQQDASFGE